jgi:hypothetical protein
MSVSWLFIGHSVIRATSWLSPVCPWLPCRRCRPHDILVAGLRLCQLRVHFIRNRHDNPVTASESPKLQRTEISLQRPAKGHLQYSRVVHHHGRGVFLRLPHLAIAVTAACQNLLGLHRVVLALYRSRDEGGSTAGRLESTKPSASCRCRTMAQESAGCDFSLRSAGDSRHQNGRRGRLEHRETMYGPGESRGAAGNRAREPCWGQNLSQ